MNHFHLKFSYVPGWRWIHMNTCHHACKLAHGNKLDKSILVLHSLANLRTVNVVNWIKIFFKVSSIVFIFDLIVVALQLASNYKSDRFVVVTASTKRGNCITFVISCRFIHQFSTSWCNPSLTCAKLRQEVAKKFTSHTLLGHKVLFSISIYTFFFDTKRLGQRRWRRQL